MKFNRQEILSRLRNQVEQKKAILMFGAGTGLTAKCAEAGGADLIGIYSTAIFRMQGFPSILAWLPYGDCNEHMFRMAKNILPMVKETPCIAGVGAHHPGIDFERTIDRLQRLGFSGVNNEPFSGLYGEFFSSQLERAGVGFSREVELIRCARKREFFSVAWAMSAEESARMSAAGADIIGAMIGVTSGGISGSKVVMSLEKAVEEVQKMVEAAKRENPEVMILTHGGPFADPVTAEYSLKNSGAVGYASGSSGERVPTEEAVITVTKKYKDMKICI